jgi:Xaa-Pro aminopeptidase
VVHDKTGNKQGEQSSDFSAATFGYESLRARWRHLGRRHYGVRIGDSVVVTERGFEYLTDFPRNLTVL